MGFFDKIKAAANKLTGGGAKVTITIEGTDVKSTIKVNVTAEIKDAPIEIKKVYLWVKSVEKINIPRNEMQKGVSLGEKPDHGVNIEKDVFTKQEFEISGAETLQGGQTYNWSYEFQLSTGNINPSYQGRFARHEWLFQVGLDAKGNDPDSGWQMFKLA